MDIPNPVFLIVFAYPLIRNRINVTNRRSLDLLALVLIAFFVAWAAGSQQSRFLTPLYPGLAIIASSVLISLQTRTNRVRMDQIIKIGAAGGMVIVSLLMMGKLFFLVKPYMVTTGLASKDRFLSSLVNNYAGMKYVNQQLPASARVLMPWDGRGYYCLTGKCLPDVDQNSWTSLVKRAVDSEELSKRLENNA